MGHTEMVRLRHSANERLVTFAQFTISFVFESGKAGAFARAGTSFKISNCLLGPAIDAWPARLRLRGPRPAKPDNPGRPMEKPTEDQIRQRAHDIWERHHRPEGRDEEFWHQAEQELQEADDLEKIANSPGPTLLPG
jgi:hypothetical protein